ncbi:MAG: inorganic phosphate transporter [Verrucomicrobiota bacterium]|nr:inorganic phosphate transporter [Verrucomicrobiota bacterium]
MLAALIETSLPYGQMLLILAVVFGFYMAWNIGANDVANAMGTSVGSGAITVKQAVIIAGIMELAGAVLAGSDVTNTVRKGIFDPTAFEPMSLVLGFLAALLAAAVWLQIATWKGWPVSTTHSIVGAVVGIAIMIGGTSIVSWGGVIKIAASWVTSPLCGGIISFLLFRFIQGRIINNKRPLQQTYRYTPYLVFYIGFVLTLVMVYKGLKNLKLDLNLGQALIIAAIAGAVCFAVSLSWVKKIRAKHEIERADLGVELEDDHPEGVPFVRKSDPEMDPILRPPLTEGSDTPSKRWEYRREFEYNRMEKIFGLLMVLSACFLAFAHGANDVANAIGPLAAVVDIVQSGEIAEKSAVPIWVLLLGGAGIVIGLATWGYKVMETVGKKITELTPSRGFAANIGAATTIVVASRMGMPISTTHTLIGAVLGIGLARGIDYLNLKIVRDIAISWIITIPAGGGLAALFYLILNSIFGGATK